MALAAVIVRVIYFALGALSLVLACDASAQLDLGSEWRNAQGGAMPVPSPGSTLALASEGGTRESPPLAGAQRDAGSPKLSGFYDLELAYTYARRAHWSRAVNRLQLAAQGELSPDIKYKLGGRIDVDPVYFGSDFYPDPVKHDQRFKAIWSENYLDFGRGDWVFRLGAQQIVWGEVVGLFFADVVSARDEREFVLPSFDLIRIPQWAARAEYFAGDAHVELVWIPVPTFDRIGKPGADFYPLPVKLTGLSSEPDIGTPQQPDRNLRNSNYGIRGNALFGGWDVAGFYYRSFSTDPTFYRVSAATDPALRFEPRYDHIWQIGATATNDFSSFVFRSEAVFTYGRNFSTTNPSSPEARRQTLDWVVSAEWPFANEGRLNLQAFHRIYFGGRDDIVPNAGEFGISVLLSTKLRGALEPQVLWIQSIGGGGGLVRPRLNWSAAKNTTVAVGLDIFTGSADSFFGRFNDRDRIYTELRYDF